MAKARSWKVIFIDGWMDECCWYRPNKNRIIVRAEEDPQEFTAQLTLKGYAWYRGGGGVALFDSTTKRGYYMTIGDFLEMLKSAPCNCGHLPPAKYDFKKRGTHRSIRLVA